MPTFPARTFDRVGGPPGFTLLELLLVLAVLMVMIGLAVPTFDNLLQGDLPREVNRLSGVIRLLRNEAVLTNSRFRLMVDPRTGGYHVEQRNEDGNYERRSDPRELRAHAFPGSLTVKDVVLFGEVSQKEREEVVAVLIDASGYVDPFLLHLSSGDTDYTLRVAGFTGRVSLEEGYVER